MSKSAALSIPYPWWVHAVSALVIGFGSAQDNARRLGDSTGWSLVGRFVLVAFGVAVFVGSGWIAFEKFRARGAIRT